MEVWIVGKLVKEHDEGIEWEFQGVFSKKELAISACVDDLFFIGPAEIDKELPLVQTDWIGCYYPRMEDGPRVGFIGKY